MEFEFGDARGEAGGFVVGDDDIGVVDCSVEGIEGALAGESVGSVSGVGAD